MTIQDLKKLDIPDVPGVYFFHGPLQGGPETILYIGKATSLRSRLRSYFGDGILKARGLHIANMIAVASRVTWEASDSVLEAVLLESELIKKHVPYYNSREKDDKSFNCVVVTKEDYPRVLMVRARTVEQEKLSKSARAVFGPFPSGLSLKEAMKIIRRIFPYRDTCAPNSGKPCFNRQLGLCPGVCSGEMGAREYRRHIRHLEQFFKGKKREVVRALEREMKKAARDLEFERAAELRKRIFALDHIKDVALIKDTDRPVTDKPVSIEAYDIAHISGTSRVGSLAVIRNGHLDKDSYRRFRLSKEKNDDIEGLSEVLRRRFRHVEWAYPDIVAVDGSVAQKRAAERILLEFKLPIPVVAVVKNAHHKPERILGDRELVDKWGGDILRANAEAHRFALSYHDKLRRAGAKAPRNKR